MIDRVKNGSLLVHGKVGSADTPHLVMPITVEPTKPRMCRDKRFLDLWIKRSPFPLDYITNLPCYVRVNHFQTTIDDESGYGHALRPQSRISLEVISSCRRPFRLAAKPAHIFSTPLLWLPPPITNRLASLAPITFQLTFLVEESSLWLPQIDVPEASRVGDIFRSQKDLNSLALG